MGRQQLLIDRMTLADNEAVIVHNRSNLFYLSGYTGEGIIILTRSLCAIITDFRYTEQAEREAPDYKCYMTDKEMTRYKRAASLLSSAGVVKIWFEDDIISVKEYAALQNDLDFCLFEPIGDVIGKLREIKDLYELSCIRSACDVTSAAFEYIITYIRAGMTEKEIALALENYMLAHGADRIAFPSIVAAGANGSLPHATPGHYRVLNGDMVTLDFGANVKGYCADMTRTIAVGQPGEEMRKIYHIVYEAQCMAEKALAAGKTACDIDQIARGFIDSMGYQGRFGHGLGHSLGIDIHESPGLTALCKDIVQPGHVFTVEPGIYLPGIGGVRIENTCVVTDTGAESLTHASKELIIL